MSKIGFSRIAGTSLLALALATAFTSSAQAADTPASVQVSVQDGALRGSESDGINRFLNIPYATPPVGDLRWKDPEPAKPWASVRDATQYGPACPQGNPSGKPLEFPTSEDCLTLNIWAPAKHNGPLPVMMWIHGGGHMWGSGREPTFDGTAFAKKGVLLVTINYRLGVLGFMAHPELNAESPHHSSGNYGILDQIEALKWIKQNIAAFGGDPNNVTIFGESAGSGAVNILQASPLAKGLFNRTIGESTSQMDPDGGMAGRLDLQSAGELGKAFADKVGAHSLAELRAMSPDKLLSVPVFFWPTERDNYVLPDLVYNIFAQGKQNDVPTLVGSNSYEGGTLRKGWQKPDASEKAQFDALYANSKDLIGQNSTDNVEWQMRVWAKLQAENGRNKSWLYWFDEAWPGKPELGSFHGAEIVYVFQTLDTQKQPWTAADRKVSDLVSSYWVNFARNGNPNGPGLPEWPSYNAQDPKLMRLAPDPGVITTPRPQAQEFLDAYFAERR